MLTDVAEIWCLFCNLISQCWCRVSLKSYVVCQSYGNVYSLIVFFVDTVYIHFVCSTILVYVYVDFIRLCCSCVSALQT